MSFDSEIAFEGHIRQLIEVHITGLSPRIYALRNKKAVDILICRDGKEPALFFIEVKFHKKIHGRLGFGSGGGGGFQPEIVSRQPDYFERNLRWVLGSEEHEPGKVLFISSQTVRDYLAGGIVGEKFNNIQKRIFREEEWLSETEFVSALQGWVGHF